MGEEYRLYFHQYLAFELFRDLDKNLDSCDLDNFETSLESLKILIKFDLISVVGFENQFNQCVHNPFPLFPFLSLLRNSKK